MQNSSVPNDSHREQADCCLRSVEDYTARSVLDYVISLPQDLVTSRMLSAFLIFWKRSNRSVRGVVCIQGKFKEARVLPVEGYQRERRERTKGGVASVWEEKPERWTSRVDDDLWFAVRCPHKRQLITCLGPNLFIYFHLFSPPLPLTSSALTDLNYHVSVPCFVSLRNPTLTPYVNS